MMGLRVLHLTGNRFHPFSPDIWNMQQVED